MLDWFTDDRWRDLDVRRHAALARLPGGRCSRDDGPASRQGRPHGAGPDLAPGLPRPRVRRDVRPGLDVPHRSEEHTSELQSLMRISYAVFCLKKKNTTNKNHTPKN